MARYVKRMLRRRIYCESIECVGDHTARPDGTYNKLSDDRIIKARIQYYHGKLVDTMLKILYLER